MRHIRIYVKRTATSQPDSNRNVLHHTRFLEGARFAFLQENREELGNLIDLNHIGEVMISFPPQYKIGETLLPEHRSHDYDFTLHVCSSIPKNRVQGLIDCFDNGDYKFKVEETRTPS